MDNNIDLKGLWKKQTIIPPNIDELFSKLNKFKRSSLIKLILLNILLIATTAFILFIWYYYQPQLITTKIGIVLTVLSIIIYLFAYNQLFPSLKTIDNKQNNNEYLQNLISIKTKQQFLQSTMLNLYFIMLSLGICLYMYEYASMMTIFWAIFAYTSTLAWIRLNWFYIRPRQIKKQETKINELLSKFEAINKQLESE